MINSLVANDLRWQIASIPEHRWHTHIVSCTYISDWHCLASSTRVRHRQTHTETHTLSAVHTSLTGIFWHHQHQYVTDTHTHTHRDTHIVSCTYISDWHCLTSSTQTRHWQTHTRAHTVSAVYSSLTGIVWHHRHQYVTDRHTQRHTLSAVHTSLTGIVWHQRHQYVTERHTQRHTHCRLYIRLWLAISDIVETNTSLTDTHRDTHIVSCTYISDWHFLTSPTPVTDKDTQTHTLSGVHTSLSGIFWHHRHQYVTDRHT